MVVGRITSLSTPLAIALAIALAAGACVKRQTLGSQQVTGTCEGACEHYVSCKKSDDPALLRRCVRECRSFYTDDSGAEDAETLGLFERLDCEETVSFVEGEPSVGAANPGDGDQQSPATRATPGASDQADTDDN